MFKIGDRVVMSCAGKQAYPNDCFNPHYLGGTIIEPVSNGRYSTRVFWDNGHKNSYGEGHLEFESLVTPSLVEKLKKPVPDGGPQEYYDLPHNAITLNDLIEYKSDKHWLGDSFHLSNLLKATWRWGIKSGTSKEYDARKFIYSGARLLKKYAGTQAVRDTLQRMLDDPQFKD